MFSVVIPVYNKQEFIERTVASVLRQSFSDFELIVVDDGSTDRSVVRLSRIADPRLTIVRQRNAGVSAARNTGLRHARRDWIALLDADDYWFPDHLDELARMAARYPEAGLLAASYLEGIDPAAAQPPERGSISPIDYFSAASRQLGIVWSSAVALRRAVTEQVGGFGPFRRGEDLEYWARMALVAPVVKSTRVTAYYFRNETSLMAQADMERLARKPKPNLTLAESWPSWAYLAQTMDNPEQAGLKPALAAYGRNLGYITIVGYVANGDYANARFTSRTLPLGSSTDRAALITLLLRLPDPILRILFGTLRRMRR